MIFTIFTFTKGDTYILDKMVQGTGALCLTHLCSNDELKKLVVTLLSVVAELKLLSLLGLSTPSAGKSRIGEALPLAQRSQLSYWLSEKARENLNLFPPSPGPLVARTEILSLVFGAILFSRHGQPDDLSLAGFFNRQILTLPIFGGSAKIFSCGHWPLLFY